MHLLSVEGRGQEPCTEAVGERLEGGKLVLKNPVVHMVVAGAVCVLLSAGIGCLVVAGVVLAPARYLGHSRTRIGV